MSTASPYRERIRTPRGKLFELRYDSQSMRYIAEGPLLGGSVVPVQGARIRVESWNLDTEKAIHELISQLTEEGY